METEGMISIHSSLVIQHTLTFVFVVALFIAVIIITKMNTKYMKHSMQHQSENFDKFLKAVLEQNRKFTDDLLTVISKLELAKQNNKSEQLYAVFDKIKHIINDDLHNIMASIDANRIAVYLFHNGTHTPSGFSFLKMSCIGERIKIGSGVKEEISFQSQIPVNIFDDMYENLNQNGRYLINNDENTMATAKRQFISAAKIKYSQAVCIYDANNNVLGFTLAEFDHIYNKSTVDWEYDQLAEFCKKLSPIFSYADYISLTLKE